MFKIKTENKHQNILYSTHPRTLDTYSKILNTYFGTFQNTQNLFQNILEYSVFILEHSRIYKISVRKQKNLITYFLENSGLFKTYSNAFQNTQYPLWNCNIHFNILAENSSQSDFSEGSNLFQDRIQIFYSRILMQSCNIYKTLFRILLKTFKDTLHVNSSRTFCTCSSQKTKFSLIHP